MFDFQYPINKCDLIAIPDFSAGAMENWGLITYRETALLIDPETATISNRQRVALVVSHELVHQWYAAAQLPPQLLPRTQRTQSHPLSGLVTWSLLNGGASYGSMKGLQRALLVIISYYYYSC